MKRIEWKGERAEKIVEGSARAILAAIFSGAALFGGYAPFAVGMAASAGSGWQGLCALFGAAVGALCFLDFSHALRTIAECVLLFTANNAFFDLKIYQKKWFLPALTAAMMLSVEFVYVLKAGADEIAFCLICLCVAAAAAYSCRIVLTNGKKEENGAALMVVLLGVLMAAASLQTSGGFAPGRILAMLVVILLAFERTHAQAIPAALCVGLAVDLAGQETGFLHAAAYALSALSMGFAPRGDRVRAALWFLGGILLFALPLYARDGVMLLYEGLFAALCFLLIPSKLLRGKRAAALPEEENVWSRRLKESASALREVYDNLPHSMKQETEENPAVIYDRAAEKVCRGCALCDLCWEKEYSRTYNALNDATAVLLQNGQGRGENFSAYFVDRCIHFSRLLDAINTELKDYLLRQSYRRRLREERLHAAGQYAEFSELLLSAAQRGESRTAMACAPMPYQVGIALQPKAGQRTSGDSTSVFEVEDKLYLILSDGMGSGEAACKESAMAVRLMERFLHAGVDARPALKTLNSALMLRAKTTGSFTTVDFLQLSLATGEGELYKYGAAPSYVKRGGRVKRINCSCLPAGLQNSSEPPEMTPLRLSGGMFFIMVSDGVVDAQDDEWLQNLLAGWEGDNPQLLVSAILADSMERKGKSDDAGAIALYLPQNGDDAREV